MTTITALERHSEERRTTLLGASQIPIALGLSPYERPVTLFQRYKGLVPWDQGGNEEAKELGHVLEPHLIAYAAKRTGRSIRHNTLGYINDRYPWFVVSPDGLTVERDADGATVQAKSAMLTAFSDAEARERWGYDGSSEAPLYVVAQALLEGFGMTEQGMRVTECYVPAALGGRGRVLYVIPYDAQVACKLFNQGREWWERHIVDGEPPEMDGSEEFTAYLARRFRTGTDRIIEHEDSAICDEWVKARAERKDAEKREEMAKQRALALIGDAKTLRGKWGVIHHIRCDGQMGFSQPALRARLQDDWGLKPEEADALIDKCMKRGDPYSYPAVYPKKKKEG